MTVLTTLNDRELAAWAEAWAYKHLPPRGNVQKVILELVARVRKEDQANGARNMRSARVVGPVGEEP